MAKNNKRKIPLLFIILIGLPILIFAIVAARSVKAPDSFVYAKVKVSQGLWWVSTAKPSLWLANSVKKGDFETNLLGQKIAEITRVNYYPYFSENAPYEDSYQVYLTVKIAADSNTKTGKTVFKRNSVAVGSPIEFEFPSTNITGTVMDISNKPFDENYVEKIIYLTKRLAYPWEYDAIKIGSVYNNGEEDVFKVLDKVGTATATLSPDSYGNLTAGTLEPTRYVTVKALIKVTDSGGELIFGEEKSIKAGNLLTVSTPDYIFEDYVISRIE